MQWKHTFFNYLLLIGMLLSGTVLWVNYYYVGNLTLLLSACIFFAAFMLSLLLYNRTALKSEEKYELLFENDLLECRHPENPNEQIVWDELSQIFVISTDKGPYEPYLWVSMVDGHGSSIMFPFGAKNSKAVVEKILGLDGFDLKLWSQAMNSTENKKFLVWTGTVKIS